VEYDHDPLLLSHYAKSDDSTSDSIDHHYCNLKIINLNVSWHWMSFLSRSDFTHSV